MNGILGADEFGVFKIVIEGKTIFVRHESVIPVIGDRFSISSISVKMIIDSMRERI